MADTNIVVVLGMLFLTLSSANVLFSEQKLIWKSYTAAKALLTTKQVELICKEKFAKTTLDEQSKTFVIHVTTLKALLSDITIHPSQIA